MKKKNLKRKLFNEKGITLIALVVTIVVLIILALIGINATFGEGGILSDASRARDEAANMQLADKDRANEFFSENPDSYNEVNVPGLPEGGITLEKTIISQPANGSRYTVGENIVYRIILTNTGSVNIQSFVVEDKVESKSGVQDYSFTSLTYPNGQTYLNVGETGYIDYAYTVKEEDAGGNIRNTATIVETVPPVPKGHKVPTVEIPTEEPKPDIFVEKKIMTPPRNGKYYFEREILVYRLTVRNTGNTRINSFEIKDTITAGSGEYPHTFTTLTNPEGQTYLDVGQEGYIEYQYTVKKEDRGTPIKNMAEIVDTEPQIPPPGHKIPPIEIPTEPQEERFFHIYKIDEEGKLLPGAVIEIYTDEACSHLYGRVDLQENGFCDHSYDIPPVGTYYVKEVVVPSGYNKISDILKFEITEEKEQEWVIVNSKGEKLPETSGGVLEIWTNSKGWKVGLVDGFSEREVFNDIRDYGQSTTMHIYRLGSVDDSDNITYSESIRDISDLPTKFSDFEENVSDDYLCQEFIENICYEQGVENVNDLGLESYLEINLETYEKFSMADMVYPDKEINGKTDLFIIYCDDIITNRYKHVFVPLIIKLEKDKLFGTILTNQTKVRVGRVEIETEVLDYPSDYPSTIVYKVEAKSNDELVYSNIISELVTNSEKKTVMLDYIPSGTTVTVTQMYAGATSKCISQTTQQSDWDYFAEEKPIYKVSFTNQYVESNKEGYGIRNRFYYWDGIWNWEKDYGGEGEEYIYDLNTGMEEEFADWTKRMCVYNNGNEYERGYYVRVRAFSVLDDRLIYNDYGQEVWEQNEDGWCYYSIEIQDGDSAADLLINLNGLLSECENGLLEDLYNFKLYNFEGENEEEHEGENADFNVVVVFEAIPASKYNGTW